ncbi:MAG: hypothetical protein AAF502_25450, partial [Bacteroidota bacterium]
MKINIPLFLIFLVSNLIPFNSKACNCSWEGPFLKSAPDKQLIIAAKVIGYSSEAVFRDMRTPTSMTVEVLHILKGKESRKKLTIWGDNGSLCRPFLQMFPINETFVFALNESNGKGKNSFEEDGHYFIPGCGINWLGLYGSYVYGQINSHIYKSAMWLDYLSFKVNLIDREPAGKTDSLALSIIQRNFKRSDIAYKGIFERKCRDRLVASYDTEDELPAKTKKLTKSLEDIHNCGSGKGYYIFWEENGSLYMNLINDCIYSKRPIKLEMSSRFFSYYKKHSLKLLQDRQVYTHAPEGNVCADVIHLYDGNSVYVNLLWDFQQSDRVFDSDLIENWMTALYEDITEFETMLEDPVFFNEMIKKNKIKTTSGA